MTYYSPYVSGLTNVAKDLSEGMAHRGHHVQVLTTRHDSDLPAREKLNGVTVRRAWAPVRLSKASVAPGFIPEFIRLSAGADVAHIHAPLPEAGALARLARCPVILTYQCDASVGSGVAAKVIERALDVSHTMAARASRYVLVSSDDYAQHSRIANELLIRSQVLYPPARQRPSGIPKFRETTGLHVGFLGRVVREKGIPQLIRAFRRIDDPLARLLIAGDYEDVAGGSIIEEVRKEASGDDRIRIMGRLAESDIADLHASIDVFCLPSIDSLEAFGIVQSEALMAGVPVVASDRPGVRVPVQLAGVGEVVDVHDSAKLSAALVRTAGQGLDAQAHIARLTSLLGLEAIVSQYESLLLDLVSKETSR